MEIYDFIVVGGGPGGCVSASRLTEDPDVSVALLEVGPDRHGFLADCSAAGSAILATKKNQSNWAFDSVPQAGLNGRRAYHPLGRGLGGGSAINALAYVRGHRSDYDEWAFEGNPGWSYDEVLPYFKKAENNQTFRDEFHGNDGPMWVEELRTDNPYHGIVTQACLEAGLPANPDTNGAEQEGFRLAQVMMKGGERWSAGKAYIHPHLDTRRNLTLLTQTECTRILFEGKRAVGVEVVNNGAKRVIRCRREVIVAAGGILSAKLLLLSGIGEPQALQSLGIEVLHALPGVGKNLKDHLDMVLGYHIPGDPNLLAISPIAGIAMLNSISRWRRERRGMLATNFAELTGYLRLSPDSPKPEIQYQFVVSVAVDNGRKLYSRHGISVHVVLLHPKSSGTVTLSSADFSAPPNIDFNYLDHPDDLPTLLAGTKRVQRIFEGPTFSRLVKKDLITGHCQSDADLIQVIRNTAGTDYHPVGTCRMGPASDPTAVVDARLRVHGLDGLRIVDSSIMPNIVGGNTMAPTIMIGEKGADMIKADWK